MEREVRTLDSDLIVQVKDERLENHDEVDKKLEEYKKVENKVNDKAIGIDEKRENCEELEENIEVEVNVEVKDKENSRVEVKVEVKDKKTSQDTIKNFKNSIETENLTQNNQEYDKFISDEMKSSNKYFVVIEVHEKKNEKGEEIIDVEISIKNTEKDIFHSHIQNSEIDEKFFTSLKDLKHELSTEHKEDSSTPAPEKLKKTEEIREKLSEDPTNNEELSLTIESNQSNLIEPCPTNDENPDSSKEFPYDEIQPIECLKSEDSKGNVLVNQYRQIKTLGRGSSAKVKLLSLNESFFAAKIFTKSFLSNKKDYIETDTGELIMTNALTDFYREIAIMKKLKHPNILCLKEVIYDVSTDKFYLIMDYCEKGAVMEWDEDLEAFYFPWTKGQDIEKFIHQICKGAVQGLYYLHYHNIAHRDIKPQNLLLSEDLTVKLADFGQSHIISDTIMARRTLGTCTFYPPECCGDELDFDPKPCDIWALGLTFYALLYKKMPFESYNEYKVFENILNFQLEFPEGQKVDERLKDLISKMLEKDPAKRINVDGMKIHPYINQDENIEVITEEKISVSDEEIMRAVSRVGSIFSAVFDI